MLNSQCAHSGTIEGTQVRSLVRMASKETNMRTVEAHLIVDRHGRWGTDDRTSKGMVCPPGSVFFERVEGRLRAFRLSDLRTYR